MKPTRRKTKNREKLKNNQNQRSPEDSSKPDAEKYDFQKQEIDRLSKKLQYGMREREHLFHQNSPKKRKRINMYSNISLFVGLLILVQTGKNYSNYTAMELFRYGSTSTMFLAYSVLLFLKSCELPENNKDRYTHLEQIGVAQAILRFLFLYVSGMFAYDFVEKATSSGLSSNFVDVFWVFTASFATYSVFI